MIHTALKVYGVADQRELVARFHEHLLRNGERPVDVDDKVAAYVSDNRWVVDCPNCGSGAAVNPHQPKMRALCFQCGETRRVTFPSDWRDAEQVLMERPAKNRHWFPSKETVEDLRAENAGHGIGGGSD